MSEWAAVGRATRDFQYALFFELESQRAARKKEINAALRSVAPLKLDLENWVRLVNFKYCLTPLSPAGSLQWMGGRFNYGREIDPGRFPPFPALYLAEDHQTGYCEYHQLAPTDVTNGLTPEELNLEKPGSWATLKLLGHVSNTYDLTAASNLAEFCKIISKFTLSKRVRRLEKAARVSGTSLVRSPNELLTTLLERNWLTNPVHFDIPSNSQLFGRLLIDAGFEAVLYKSSKTLHRCIAVFTQQLVGSDTVIGIHDDRPEEIELCELNGSNCLNT
jgi:hypothetical protein